MKNSKPNYFNRVTTLSKTLAFILFITLPILGFYWGIHYQKSVSSPEDTNSSSTHLSGTFNFVTPEGWKTIYDSETNYSIEKNVGDDSFRIGIQVIDTDYFKGGGYLGASIVLKNVTTSKGTKLFVVKNDSNVFLSSCEPLYENACSLPYNGRFLFVMMNMYRPGDQYPRELNFQDMRTTEAISDLTKFATSSSL